MSFGPGVGSAIVDVADAGTQGRGGLMEQVHRIALSGQRLDEILEHAARELSDYFGEHEWRVDRIDASALTHQLRRGDGSLLAIRVDQWEATVEASVPGLRLRGELEP